MRIILFVYFVNFLKSSRPSTERQMESLQLLFCRKDFPGTDCISGFCEQSEVLHNHFHPRLPQAVTKKMAQAC